MKWRIYKEADDSFTRGDRPQIRKVFSDEEFTVDEFVERIQEAKEEIEDIIIFNRDMYEDQDEPLKVFLADVCQGKHIEDALDLGFYMNQPAYDQLPKDIQKYVSFNTGTCNFRAQKWVTDIFNDMMDMDDIYSESSRFGFNVGDKVELTKDKSNTFTGETVKAGTQGEVVAVDKPMPGVIKVKIEGGKVVSVPERQLKKAGEDEEPWKKLKAPEQPKRDIRPEKPEDYYMRPTSYGSPRYTGD
jgi:hypothetical protein